MALSLVVAAGAAAPASARSTVDLFDGGVLRLDGAAADDFTGYSVAGVGDVNGDGVDDFATGAPAAGNLRGTLYVLYGRRDGTLPTVPVDLADTNGSAAGTDVAPADGFRILGAAGDRFGLQVDGAGDVNGDGVDDLVVTASGAPGGSYSTYVLYGNRSQRGTVQVTSAPDGGVAASDGYRIVGPYSYLPNPVHGAGDVNGDGLDDVILGLPGGGGGGQAFVLYGRASRQEPVDLSDTNGAAAGTGVAAADGYRIDAAADDDDMGFSVDGAGDVNGDGLDDVVVGAPRYYNFNAPNNAGAAYVLYGRPSRSGPVELADTNGAADGTGVAPADGYRAATGSTDDALGIDVSGAGDVNADGKDDVVVGASPASKAYVLYGAASRSGPVDLRDTNGGASGTGVAATDGFLIDGTSTSTSPLGFAGAPNEGAGDVNGDVNGDGIDDLVIGAGREDPARRANVREAYVVYGQVGARTGPVSLADRNGAVPGEGIAPALGFLISGGLFGDQDLGRAVSNAGDVNGDGIGDVLVGGDIEGNNNRSQSGSAYLVLGIDETPAGPTPQPSQQRPPRAAARDTVAPVISGARLSANRFAVDSGARASAARAKRARGSTLTYRLSEPATVVYATQQLRRGKWRTVRVFTVRYRTAGREKLNYSGKIKPRGRQRPLKRGRYRLRIRAGDPAGNRGRRTTRYFRIVR